jgi:hypothetical protein
MVQSRHKYWVKAVGLLYHPVNLSAAIEFRNTEQVHLTKTELATVQTLPPGRSGRVVEVQCTSMVLFRLCLISTIYRQESQDYSKRRTKVVEGHVSKATDLGLWRQFRKYKEDRDAVLVLLFCYAWMYQC